MVVRHALKAADGASVARHHNGEGKPSPCIKQCGLEAKALCRGCFRTLDEIVNWGSYNVSQCMDVMNQINGSRGTHQCPECKGPAYCAIEDGKSASTCWCMTLPAGAKPNPQVGEECLCRGCLTEELRTPITGIQDKSGRRR